MTSPRDEIHASFVRRFQFGDSLEAVSEQQLNFVETELRTRFPIAYRRFMRRFGVIWTPSILDVITQMGTEAFDMQEFLNPAQLINDNRLCWSGGMPSEVVGFASDCMGNVFGFHRCSESVDDAPVILFDHDFVKTREIAPSFDGLLAWYLQAAVNVTHRLKES